MTKVKVEVEEKMTFLGEKSEECVIVIEKAAKKSVCEMEDKLSYLGERSEECVQLIERVAKKSVGHLKATLYLQNKSCENIASSSKEQVVENNTKEESHAKLNLYEQHDSVDSTEKEPFDNNQNSVG